ncbi:hypothetical protein BGZ51_006917 [Haplosporangium sp. Z 767]|nr:hypothetical protein BGZ51_006917 [Haplosporangium sp. Z 767]
MIFSHPDKEIWLSYPTIHTVEKGLPTLHNAWPLHIRCHNFVFVALNFQSEKDVTDVYESIQKLTCISSVEQLYAFFYKPLPPFTTTDGWQVYDPRQEYERMGVGSKNDQWRFSTLNENFTQQTVYFGKFSPTYPRYVSSTHARGNLIVDSSTFKASITRSSQPMVGLKQNRSIQDEKLIEAIFLTNIPQSSTGRPIYGSTATNLIIDARPTANAVANTAVGAGTENMENYRNCKKVYSGIENIHVMRDSLNKLVEALQEIDTKGSVSKAALQKSGWLKHIAAVMDGALMIVRNIHISNSHVLVHCSDGWDRTAQLTSVAQICLDPYYRTLRGFQVLVEKEWCSFGYKFMDRCGHLSNDKNFVALSATNPAANTFANVQSKLYNNKHIRETSPIFHQFLDCVFQTMQQNPTRFEFNEYFLTQLHYHIYSCQFGNFLFNCERDRRQYMGNSKCISIWDFINSNKEEYLNKDYQPGTDKVRGGDGGVLFPDPKAIKYWSRLFGRTDEELNSPDDNMNLNGLLSERMTPEMLGFSSNYAESVEAADAGYPTDQRVEADPLGVVASSTAPRSRPISKTSNIRENVTMGGGYSSDAEDSWQKGADNIASKFPAALSGAFGGGLNWLTTNVTNVRETWYPTTSGSNSGPSSDFCDDSQFADVRSNTANPQARSATVGRSNSHRRRMPVDRELKAISSISSGVVYTQSTSLSPKHSLADLTLEHEIHQSYIASTSQDKDPLRSGGAFKSSPHRSPPAVSSPSPTGQWLASNNRHSAVTSSSPSQDAIDSPTPQALVPDLTMALPSSGQEGVAVSTVVPESGQSPVEAIKEPVKELPHPLFV